MPHCAINNLVRVANSFFIFFVHRFYELQRNQLNHFLFFIFAEILKGKSLVFVLNLQNLGSKLANKATTMTQIIPPEITENERLVTAAWPKD